MTVAILTTSGVVQSFYPENPDADNVCPKIWEAPVPLSPFAISSRRAKMTRIGDRNNESLLSMPEKEAMKTVTLTLTLPRELATEASQAGLLTSESLVALLKREVRQRRINNLFAAIDRLDQKNTDILDIDEIAAEIAAARAERRQLANLCTVDAGS